MRLPLLVLPLLFLSPQLPAQTTAGAEVLVTIDGIPVLRDDVARRLWARHASDGLNQLVDEIVVNKALSAWRVKQTKRQQESTAADVKARLERVKSRYPSEAEFHESLRKSGTVLAGLEIELREQLERERLISSVKRLSVSPAEVREFYDLNKGTLGGPPSLRLRRLVVSGEKRAKELLASLRAGADFGKLAREASIDAKTKDGGGDLGFLPPAAIPVELQKELFALKAGEVSKVIRTPEGFHLFKVEDRREPKEPSFEEVRGDLAEALLMTKITQAWPAYVAELRAAAKIVPSPGVTLTSPPPKESGKN